MIVVKGKLSREEDDLIVKLRNQDIGWAGIAREIKKEFNIHRTPNELKNNYNQRLKKSHPDVILKPNKHKQPNEFDELESSYKMSIEFITGGIVEQTDEQVKETDEHKQTKIRS